MAGGSSNDDGMIQAFHVGHVDESEYRPNTYPTSAEEYIKQVHMEARRCEDVMIAHVCPTKFQRQTVKISNSTGCQPPPTGYAPSLEWQQQQSASFSELRRKMARWKARSKKLNNLQSPEMPDTDDDVNWCRLCFGNQFQQRLLARQESGIKGNITDTENDQGMPPVLSVLTAMSQSCVEAVLEYHVQWMEVTGFSDQQGRWFYALLTCLEKPLTPEICSLLRTLARQCWNLRAILDSSSHPHLRQLNLLICLVARYFDQLDLADS